MKALIRIPIEEVVGKNISMWAYSEVEMEVDSIEDAIELYSASKTLKTVLGQGLDKKTYDRAVEEYLVSGGLVNGTELYQQMSPSQQDWFQTTKRALKRVEAKRIRGGLDGDMYEGLSEEDTKI